MPGPVSPMSLLKSLESKIEGLVEGTFGRIFRSEVRPIELARKLVREMDAHTTTSVTKVYAPHEYDIWLSLEDRDHYDGLEGEVIDELCAYLLEHARREHLTLAARPIITFHTDRELQLGEFGIQTQPVRLDDHEAAHHRAVAEEDGDWLPEAASVRPGADLSATMLHSGARRMQEPLQAAASRRADQASLIVDGRRVALPATGVVLGRSRDCDVVLSDSGVSRRHAEVRQEGERWVVEDLGSTNGLRVGARSIKGSDRAVPLRSGDVIVLGSTEVVFELL